MHNRLPALGIGNCGGLVPWGRKGAASSNQSARCKPSATVCHKGPQRSERMVDLCRVRKGGPQQTQPVVEVLVLNLHPESDAGDVPTAQPRHPHRETDAATA